MTTCVYYHHPEDSQYSLAYVTQDRDKITTSEQDAIIEHYDLDEEFFALYTNHGASGTVENLDDEFEDVLTRSEAYEHYGDVHTELCTDFLLESVTRAGHDELISTEGIGKAEFVSFLEAGE